MNAVRYCPGILRLLSFDGRPATVHQALIDELRRLEGDRGYIVPEDFTRQIPQGTRVRVMGGPLKGLEGAFTGYVKGGQRARVLVEFLRARRQIEVNVTALAVVA